MRVARLALTAAMLVVLSAPGAAGASVYSQVLHAYQASGAVPPCRFTTGQLETALSSIDTYGAQYFQDFATAIQNALSARAGGACVPGASSGTGGRAGAGGPGGAAGSGGASAGAGAGLPPLRPGPIGAPSGSGPPAVLLVLAGLGLRRRCSQRQAPAWRGGAGGARAGPRRGATCGRRPATGPRGAGSSSPTGCARARPDPPEHAAMIAFICGTCGQLLFFENTLCLRCSSPLGFLPERLELAVLGPPGADPGRAPTPDGRAGGGGGGRAGTADGRRRCANAELAGCNWMLEPGDPAELCRSCRLTRTRPADDDAAGLEGFAAAEAAKRRLLFELYDLGLPVAEDTLRFDLLSSAAGPVSTGHADGVITIDLAESDDARREQRRARARRALPDRARPLPPRDRPLLLADRRRDGRGRAPGSLPRAVRRRPRRLRRGAASATTSQVRRPTGASGT